MEYEDKFCAICNKKMQFENKIKHVDYTCVSEEHMYGIRFAEDMFTNAINLTKMKIRLGSKQSYNYMLRINYDDGNSEVWTNNGNKLEEIPKAKINQTFTPNLSNVEKIKAKIKTMLAFS